MLARPQTRCTLALCTQSSASGTRIQQAGLVARSLTDGQRMRRLRSLQPSPSLGSQDLRGSACMWVHEAIALITALSLFGQPGFARECMYASTRPVRERALECMHIWLSHDAARQCALGCMHMWLSHDAARQCALGCMHTWLSHEAAQHSQPGPATHFPCPSLYALVTMRMKPASPQGSPHCKRAWSEGFRFWPSAAHCQLLLKHAAQGSAPLTRGTEAARKAGLAAGDSNQAAAHSERQASAE